jgi:hypothetical protein
MHIVKKEGKYDFVVALCNLEITSNHPIIANTRFPKSNQPNPRQVKRNNSVSKITNNNNNTPSHLQGNLN